jgi:hypothetical protein
MKSPKSKQLAERDDVKFARGGKGPAKKTFGTGTRTTAAPQDAAGPAVAAHTGKPQSATAGPSRATGGPPVRSPSFGGLARPAKGGQTGAP